MTPEELNKHSKTIDLSVSWIQERTNDIWNKYERMDDCYTQECDKQREILMSEMDGYIEKLHREEKMIDKYEDIIHNTTGIK